MLVDLSIPFSNSINGIKDGSGRFEDAHLLVRFARGTIRQNAIYDPDRKPTIKRTAKYNFDMDAAGAVGWLVDQSEPLVAACALAVRVVTEFIDFVEANRNR